MTISLSCPGLALPVVASLTTLADGTFVFSGAVPGAYLVTASSQDDQISSLNITLSHGTPADANFQLAAGTEIRGVVRDGTTAAPLTGVSVFALNSSGQGVTAITDSNGSYELSGLPAGTL